MAPAIQEKFRRHIQVKLNVLEQRLGIKLAERDPVIAKRRKEELSIIILDFRASFHSLTWVIEQLMLFMHDQVN
jgi:hypothetical protein